MQTSLILLALLGLVTARPMMEPSAFPANPQLDGWLTSQNLAPSADDGKAAPPADVQAASCVKASEKVQKKIRKQVLGKKLLIWQPRVPAWWQQVAGDLMVEIMIVHRVASDDFQQYMIWAASHPDVPDDLKQAASWRAARRIINVTRAAKISGKFGAYHLVVSVSQWLISHPKPAGKWFKACAPA